MMQYLAEQLAFVLPELKPEVSAMIVIACGAAAMLGFFSIFAGPISYIERRIAGRMMSRIGPNRVGPQGILQWLADGLKCWMKEDLIPDGADRPLYRIAPYLVFLGVFCMLVTIPFTSIAIIADLNVGVVYLMASSGIVVIGILMAGWASYNKWSMLGGMRSAAQMVSYEIPIGLTFLTAVVMAGSLSVQGIIRGQGASPTEWFVFAHPFGLLAFFVFFVAAVAEGNRTPFDLPEAESELVAGYNTEYSGMRFLFFFFAEWGNLYIISALASALFLGGWNLPASIEASPLATNLMQLAVFEIKTLFLVFVIIWLRWTLPRLRIDQLMAISWKYLTPCAFFALLGATVWEWVFPEGYVTMKFIMTYAAAVFAIYFVWRVRRQIVFTKSKVHLNPFM